MLQLPAEVFTFYLFNSDGLGKTLCSVSTETERPVTMHFWRSGPMFTWSVRVGCKKLLGRVGEISNMFVISTTVADPCIHS